MIKAISIKDGVRKTVEIEPMSDIVLSEDDILFFLSEDDMDFVENAIRPFVPVVQKTA